MGSETVGWKCVEGPSVKLSKHDKSDNFFALEDQVRL